VAGLSRTRNRGEKQAKDEENTGDMLYKGIAERTFERSFQLDAGQTFALFDRLNFSGERAL
jgi:hypothetical protein